MPPKPISRILQRSNEVHEDDVSEILSDFENQAEENDHSDKPVIFVTSKFKGKEMEANAKKAEKDDMQFKIDQADEFYEDEDEDGEDEEDEDEDEDGEEEEDEEEDDADETSEVQ